MKPEFTSTGLDVQTYEEIFTELSDGYKAIYGSDISIDSDDPDGQRIGIEATNLLDVQSFASYLYSSLDPDFSGGAFLDVLCKFFGVFRRPASQSQWDLELTASNSVTLPIGYTVKDDLGQEWETSTSESLAAGSNTITFVASNYGAVEGVTGATIEQVTFEPLVTAIVAGSDATIGIEEETDQDLRIRRNKSLKIPSYSTTGGLLSNILNIPGVSDAIVYENKTSTYDAVLDMDGHSLWCVIEGGSATTIVETIAKNRTGGCDLKGSESGTYYEDVVRPDGVTVQIAHEMVYDRPIGIDVYVNLTVTRKLPTSPSIDHDAIKSSIAAATFGIGDKVLASALYSDVYAGGSNFIAYNLEVSDDDITYTDGALDSTPGVKYSIDTANITITEV